jgi:hypothetical protein
MKKLEFRCCLCNQGIVENKTDPLNINIMHNIDWLNRTGRVQVFMLIITVLKKAYIHILKDILLNLKTKMKLNKSQN